MLRRSLFLLGDRHDEGRAHGWLVGEADEATIYHVGDALRCSLGEPSLLLDAHAFGAIGGEPAVLRSAFGELVAHLPERLLCVRKRAAVGNDGTELRYELVYRRRWRGRGCAGLRGGRFGRRQRPDRARVVARLADG